MTRQLNNLRMRIVDLPVNAMEALAACRHIRYTSTNRQINSFGPIENTTGAASIREQTTTSVRFNELPAINVGAANPFGTDALAEGAVTSYSSRHSTRRSGAVTTKLNSAITC